MTYGEFLRRQPSLQFRFGDMYTLAAPRVCEQPFPQEVNRRTPAEGGKYLFRIVNRNDPVPTIPPRRKDQLLAYPFVHVAGAWELSQAGASKLADEPPPVDPQPTGNIIWNIAHHRERNAFFMVSVERIGGGALTSPKFAEIKDYYANWLNTPHA